jgi:hypothetical protein
LRFTFWITFLFILFDNVIFFFISLFMCTAAAQWSEKGRICPGLPSFQKWMDDVIKAIEIRSGS